MARKSSVRPPLTLPAHSPSESARGRPRREFRRPALSAGERCLVSIVAVHLCFLPWALGDMHPWSQEISAALALLGFVVALLPRGAPPAPEFFSPDGAPPPLATGLSRLIHFPIFWLGAAFLLYIAIQGLNPAWEYYRNSAIWWMRPLDYVVWLPHGMRTPFVMANPWRCLMIDASAWLVVCSLWVGLTRRRSLRILFLVLATNAGALALLGLLERGSDATQIFWSWTPQQSYFVASFIYKNHAGAYFDLLFGLCAGLTTWYFTHRRPGTSSPVTLLVLSAAFVALIVLFSYSRAATVLLGGFFLIVPLLASASGLLSRFHMSRVLLIGLFYAGLAGLLALFFATQGHFALVRLEALFNRDPTETTPLRFLTTRATLDMFRAQPIYGWGADGFRYTFPAFQQHYPSIYNEVAQNHNRLYWDHTHDDYAEFLAEFGLAGAALAAAVLTYWTFRLVRMRFWRNPCTALLVPGCGLTLIHAAGDFPFHNPAVLLTWCTLVAGAARWAEWDPAAESRPQRPDS